LLVRVLPAPPRAPAQFRFPGALGIAFDFRRITDGAIPPIELVDTPAGSLFRYKLTAGTHRLYCSLAAGFTHVPAVEGIDITAEYI
jgi:hypothetical protein